MTVSFFKLAVAKLKMHFGGILIPRCTGYLSSLLPHDTTFTEYH